MRNARLKILGTVIAVGVLTLVGSPAFAAPPGGTALSCSGGAISSGTYSSITVTGDCAVAKDAVIAVTGNVNVQPGSSLNADSVPSTITIGRNVTAGAGSSLALGCQTPGSVGNSGHVCADAPEGISSISVGGNVSVSGAAHFALNGVSVGGNVSVSGGGTGGSWDFWSIKNNTISGNVTVDGPTVSWMGVMFNQIGKNANISNVTITDDHPGATPAVFVVRNVIARNLNCTGNTGAVGGFPGEVNTVTGNANGQCAGLAG